MSRSVSNPTESQQIAERAFVSIRYVLGARQSKLLAGLSEPGPSARHLAQTLGHRDRTERAQILASDLKPIIAALDSWRVSRC